MEEALLKWLDANGEAIIHRWLDAHFSPNNSPYMATSTLNKNGQGNHSPTSPTIPNVSPPSHTHSLSMNSSLSSYGNSVSPIGGRMPVSTIRNPNVPMPGRMGLNPNRQASPTTCNDPDVLLVEDVRVTQKLFHASLTRARFKVQVAGDGESAVEMFRQNMRTLRVILMDIQLPGISGIEATKRIRRMEEDNRRDTPVLVYGLTGNVNEADLRAYELAGMNGCIVKGKLLVNAVKQAMEMSERDPTTFVNLSQMQLSSTESTTPPQSHHALSYSDMDVDTSHLPSPTHSQPESADSDSGRSPTERKPLRLGLPSANPSASPQRVLPGLAQPPSPTLMASPPVPSPTSAPHTGFPFSQPPHPTGPDILLVEDVRVSQRITQQALTRAQYKVEVASDGESAVKKFQQHVGTLRVILMDIGLPGMSGVEATEQIRSLERDLGPLHIPTLIFGLTGNVEEANLIEYEEVGMNGCILKGKLLVHAVKTAIEQAGEHPGSFINLAGQGDQPVVGVHLPHAQ